MSESRPSKSDSHPNTDLMDTNQMPNLKLSAIDISKEPRKPRPLSRLFETFPAESKEDISNSKFEVGFCLQAVSKTIKDSVNKNIVFFTVSLFYCFTVLLLHCFTVLLFSNSKKKYFKVLNLLQILHFSN